jgi:hypothetical protein
MVTRWEVCSDEERDAMMHTDLKVIPYFLRNIMYLLQVTFRVGQLQ